MKIQALPKVIFGNSPPLIKKLEAFLVQNGLGSTHGKPIQVGFTPEKVLQIAVGNADDEDAVTALLRDPRTLMTSFEGTPVEVVRTYGFPTK
jgi:hypothetical protein